jgi:hypothetical protein
VTALAALAAQAALAALAAQASKTGSVRRPKIKSRGAIEANLRLFRC